MFENVKPTRISDQIVAQIHRLILEGKLEPGQRLPTETDLAEMFGVSRASVREALSALEFEGLVERKKNEGTFLRRYVLKQVLSAFEFPQKLDKELFADLVEAREKFELQNIELAAERADEIDLLRIRRTIEMMDEDLKMGRSGIEADILFHQCIALATKNQVLAGLASTMGQMMKETRIRTLCVPGRLKICLEEHQAIYEAICRRNSELGCQLMKIHLAQVSKILAELD